MALSPPADAQPGQPFFLSLAFEDFEGDVLADPDAVQLDITQGSAVTLVADTAGPFFYSGGSTPAAGTVWRTGTGQFTGWWQVPDHGIPAGTYLANWTVSYGGAEFLVFENFNVGGLTIPVVSGDLGYWTGSLTYQPAWSPSALSVPLGSVDSNGTAWLLQSVDGWDSPPSAVGQVVQRSADHGGWPTAAYYAPRTITLTVWASAPTQALRDTARAQLQQVVPVSDLATFAYAEPVPKQALVRRNAQATVAETCPTLTDVVFTIPLVAPDPRKYSTSPQTVSSVQAQTANPLTLPFAGGTPVTFPSGVPTGSTGILAANAGTFETRPLITVTGPVTGPGVANSAAGQTVTFSSLTLAASDQLLLDMDARQAYLNGNFTPADVSSDWWVLEPGTSLIYLTGTNKQGATLQASWSSAWI